MWIQSVSSRQSSKTNQKLQSFIVYSPTTHSKIRNCIVVRLENFWVIENFISKCVQTVEGHSNICSCHPFLEQTEIPSDETLFPLRKHQSLAVLLTKSFLSSWFLPHCFPLCTSGAHTLLSQKPYATSSWFTWVFLTLSHLWRPFPMPLHVLTAFSWEALSNLCSKKCRAGNYASLLIARICLPVVFLQSYAAPMGKALGYICLQAYCTRLKDTDRQMSEAGGGWGRKTDRSDLQHKSFS